MWLTRNTQKVFSLDTYDLSDLGRYLWGGTIFLKVDLEGKVIKSGKKVRGKEDEVYRVGIPLIVENYFCIPVSLDLPLRFSRIQIDTAMVIKIFKEFDFQEIYDQMFRVQPDVHQMHIGDFLSRSYSDSAEKFPPVIEAIDKYRKRGNAATFVTNLCAALYVMDYKPPFTNFQKVKVKVVMETPTHQFTVEYSGF